MVLTKKSDKRLIKDIKKLWFKRKSEVKSNFILLAFISSILFECCDGWLSVLLMIVGILLTLLAYAIMKERYYAQPHVYERNTRDLWEYKQELESRGYEVKVFRVTTLKRHYEKVSDELMITKKE